MNFGSGLYVMKTLVSKTSFNLITNGVASTCASRIHAAFHEAIYNYKTVGAHYCTCLHLVWNVVVTQIVYAFHSIDKKVMKKNHHSAVRKLS